MKRKKYSNALKSKVALSALKAQATTNEIASEFRVHPSQVNRWKKQALEGLPDIFGGSQRTTIQVSLTALMKPPMIALMGPPMIGLIEPPKSGPY